MPLVVGPFAPADEEDTDHLVEPDERYGEVDPPQQRGRPRCKRALLEHFAEQLDQRLGELALLAGRHVWEGDQARIESGLRLQQRALLVRHELPEKIERAAHAFPRCLRRLEHLRDIAERPPHRLAVSLALSFDHGSRAPTGVGSPVRTPRRPLNGVPTSMPKSLTFILRTSVACRTPRALSTEMPRSRRPSCSTYLSWIRLSAAKEMPCPESWAEPSSSAISMFRLNVTPRARKCLAMA